MIVMPELRLLLLIIATLIFFSFGGMIDYWQAAMEHKKKLPRYLIDFFLVIWLFIYTGILPFFIVFIASNYDIKTSGVYFGAMCIGSVLWDLMYSLHDTKKLLSDQSGYFVFKQKNYGLGKDQIALWHIIRIIIGFGCIWFFSTQF